MRRTLCANKVNGVKQLMVKMEMKQEVIVYSSAINFLVLHKHIRKAGGNDQVKVGLGDNSIYDY